MLLAQSSSILRSSKQRRTQVKEEQTDFQHIESPETRTLHIPVGDVLTKAKLFEFLKDVPDDALIGIAEPEGTDGYETPYYGVCAISVCCFGCHVEIARDYDRLYHD